MDFFTFNIKVKSFFIAVSIPKVFFPDTPFKINLSLEPAFTVDIFTPSLIFVNFVNCLSS